MTSANLSLGKRSFIKEQRAITSRRLPLAALSIRMYFLYDVCGTVMAIQRGRAVAVMDDIERAAETFPMRGAQIVSEWMGMRGAGFVIGMVGAVLLGIQGFAYLYRSQTVDFYESRPEKRSTRFRNIVLNSFLIYAIPSLLGVLCSFVLTLLNGCSASWLLAEMLITWCLQTVLFLAVYGMSTLASLLTGTVVTAFLMNCYFFGIEALLRLTIYFHRAAYYATFDSSGDDPIVSRFFTLPPFHYLSGIVTSGAFGVRNAEYDWNTAQEAIMASLPGAVFNLIIFVIAIVGAFFVYRHRKAESAGEAVISRVLAVFIKSTAAILFSLFAGLFVYWIFGANRGADLPAVILTIIITVFVGCMILEAIFGLNIRCALHRIWHAPILAAAALAILFVYRTDALGYDRWVPAAKDVETAFLVNGSYRDEYLDESGYHGTGEYIERNMYLTDIEDVCTLAGIAQEERVKSIRYGEADSDRYDYWYTTIGWRMKDGRIIKKSVQIPYTIDPTLMDRIVGSEEFVEGVYRLDGVEGLVDSWRKQYPSATFELLCETEHGHRTADIDLLDAFLDAYRHDVTEYYDFSLASSQTPIGQVSLGTHNYYGPYTELTWPLYENYDRSIAFLTEHELWPGGFLTSEEIASANVYYSSWGSGENNGGNKTEIVTDPQKIAELLDASLSVTYHSAWYRNDIFASFGDDQDGAEIYIEIYPDRESVPEAAQEGLLCYTRALLKDRIPGFVQDFAAGAESELTGS